MTSKTFVSGTTIDSAWLNDVNGATYAAASAPVVSFRASLENSSGAALIGFMPAGTGAVASTVENKVLELKSVFDFMTPNQISAAKSGLGVTDLTLPCQAAIDSGYSLEWGDSSCVFGVSKLTFDQNGKTYKFNGAAILALATTAQDCLIDWKAGYCTSYGAAFVLNYKNNYASTIHWHSASAGLPAQARPGLRGGTHRLDARGGRRS